MSPSAGQNEDLRKEVERARRNHTIVPHWAWESEDSARFADLVLQSPPDRVLIAGGDGAIHHSLHALLEKGWDKPIGLIPLGTGNDFVRSVGLHTDDISQAFDRALSDRFCEADSVQCGERSLFNVLSIGAGAEVTSSAGILKELGPVGYSIKGLSLLLSAEPFEASIRWEGGEWEGRPWGICVGNGKFAGGGVPVCPQAQVNDGQLDLVCFVGDNLAEAATRILRYTSSGTSDNLITAKSPSFEIQLRGTPSANLDGEPSEGDRYHLQVRPRAFTVAGGSCEN